MFDTPKKESMNNVIAYVVPKNKTMAHIMSLNNMISCVVVISIFGFKTYWKQVFNLMEIKTTPTFKNFLQAETLNSKKNKSYYHKYDVQLLWAFHEQAKIKNKCTIKYLQGDVGWYIVQGCSFKQVSSTFMRKNHSPQAINQKISNKSGANVAPSSIYELPQRISLWDLQL